MTVTIEEIESQAILSTKFEPRLQLAVEGLNPYFQRLLLEMPE